MCICSYAHGSWQMHAQDMYEVLQLADDTRLTEWMRFVSSELIDGHGNFDKVYQVAGEKVSFYNYLKAKYPGFKCKHRLLYHWGYNSRPWSESLEEKVQGLGWKAETINSIKQDFIAEQKRRNSYTNELTENLFHYGHSGKEARVARILVSIIYDTHIIGDYEPDNSDLEGLQDFNAVVGDIINQIRTLDNVGGKQLIKDLQSVQKANISDIQKKAEQFMITLKKGFSTVLQNAEGGDIKKHLEESGFRFTKRTIREISN